MGVSVPRRHIIGIGASVASVAAFAGRSAFAASASPDQVVKWDDDAADEVMTLLHHMHHAWNDRDLDFIQRSIADEGFVGTFELTGDEHPSVLNTREELVAFVGKLFAEQESTGSQTEAAPRKAHQVLATSTFAICTEECDLIERHADGSRSVLPHRGTSALAKTADGWKFVHWHVSQGGPAKVYDASGKETASA